MYLTYDEYLNYGGSITDETLYDRNEFKARTVLDMITQNRITDSIAEHEAIKRCMFELVDAYELERQQNANGIGISSVKNDTVEISYSTTTSASTELRTRCNSIVSQYLSSEVDENGESLLFKGVI